MDKRNERTNGTMHVHTQLRAHTDGQTTYSNKLAHNHPLVRLSSEGSVL